MNYYYIFQQYNQLTTGRSRNIEIICDLDKDVHSLIGLHINKTKLTFQKAKHGC